MSVGSIEAGVYPTPDASKDNGLAYNIITNNVFESVDSEIRQKIEKLPIAGNIAINFETVKRFIEENMLGLPHDEVDNILRNHIKEHFGVGLKTPDIRNLISYYKRRVDEKITVDTVHENGGYSPAFEDVARNIMNRMYIITFDDTKEIYIYKNGVYTNIEAVSILKEAAISEFATLLAVKNMHVYAPAMKYVSEVLEYIRIYTRVLRHVVDNDPRHKHIINMQNGLYDVCTGEFKEHDPTYVTVNQIPVKYDKNATCPHFIKFMSEIMSPADVQFMLEFIGVTLVYDMRHEVSVMLQGEGSNGKSKLIEFIIALHGIDNICTTSLQRLCDDRFAMAELYGKKLNVFPDMSSKMIKDDEEFKGLTTGDMLTAQRKFGQPFQFRNQARQIYSVNEIPPVSSPTFAYFRRWAIMKFPFTFVDKPTKPNEKKKDRDLATKLITDSELSGAFNVIMDCLRHMYKQGHFTYTQTVEEVKTMYLKHSDPAKLFMDLYTRPADGYIPKNDLYNEFERWQKGNGIQPMKNNMFSRRLKKMGIDETKLGSDGSRTLAWADVDYSAQYHEDSNAWGNENKQTTIKEFEDKHDMSYWEKYLN